MMRFLLLVVTTLAVVMIANSTQARTTSPTQAPSQASCGMDEPGEYQNQACRDYCEDIYYADVLACQADNFASPNNTMYALCIIGAGSRYNDCRNNC